MLCLSKEYELILPVTALLPAALAVLAAVFFVLLVYATLFAGNRTRWGRQTEGKA